MATFRVFGPIPIKFGETGLAPGQTRPTFWTTDPQTTGGTVTVTAFPNTLVQAPSGEPPLIGTTKLAVHNTAVEQIPNPPESGGAQTVIHADLVNVGNNPVRDANVYISFVEL